VEGSGNPVSEARAELLAAAESVAPPPAPPPPHPKSERAMAAELDWMNSRLLMFNEMDEALAGIECRALAC
jgi:hypothetical protein